MTRLCLNLLLISILALVPFTAQAEDKALKKEVGKLAEKNKKKVEDEIKKETPITEWLTSENALLDRLPKDAKQTFFILRTKHSTIRAVETVKRDVKSAIDACSAENKDMKAAMKERFIAWEKAIDPIIDDARQFLKTELKEQTAFHVSDYNHIIDLNDKAYAFSDKQVIKTPVTTKKACNNLLKSMDRTEDNLISLMQDILIPEDVIRSRSRQAKQAKEKKPETPKK